MAQHFRWLHGIGLRATNHEQHLSPRIFHLATIIQIPIWLLSLLFTTSLYPRVFCALFNYRQSVQLMCDVRCVCSAATHFQLLSNVFLRRPLPFGYLSTWTLSAAFSPSADGVELVAHSRLPIRSFSLLKMPRNLDIDVGSKRFACIK